MPTKQSPEQSGVQTLPLQALDSTERQPVRRALLSVFDKTGLVELASALVAAGVELVSTGSTSATIEKAGLPVTAVEKVTGFPECLDGRVKTLHPKIHAGILADRRLPEHVRQLQELGVTPFDLVVCNLYPFSQTVASGAGYQDCIEKIDIGGPSMVRAAAKNHACLAVIVDPADYGKAIEAVKAGGFTLAERTRLAAAAFHHTATYDRDVDNWFATQLAQFDSASGASAVESTATLPESLQISADRLASLRYGENPHQGAAVYLTEAGHGLNSAQISGQIADGQLDAEQVATGAEYQPAPGLAHAIQLHGKAMSYNNYTDGDAAWRAAWDHAEPCVAIIKHANPCGIAVGPDVASAHRRAHACDPLSAFGGVIAVNRPVSVQLAEQIAPIFTEVLLAPAYEPGALAALAKKKNLRVLRVSPTPATPGACLEMKQISGGWLAQSRDQVDQAGDTPDGWQLVAGPAADEQTLADLTFAWRAVRAVKSNAVLLAKDGATVGVGMGQVNRVDSCRLAVERANTLGADASEVSSADAAGGADGSQLASSSAPRRSEGAVCASDAFFPFPDGPEFLIDAGVKAIVQPGGSIRDEQTIKLCEEKGITMYFTGVRHFFH